MDLVSVIIPVYNRSDTLGETLDSLINQTHQNWECLVVDDHSDDYTLELIEFFQDKDLRIKLISNKGNKSGAAFARNLGLLSSSGCYVQFLDSDDIIAENKFEEQIKLLRGRSVFSIATCKWDFFTVSRDPLQFNLNKADFRSFDEPEEYFNVIGAVGGFYPPICFLVRRELINFSGFWNESLTLNDDGEFFFRIILNSKKICFTENTYARYRSKSKSGVNLSSLNSEDKALSLINSWKIIEALYQTKYLSSQSPYLFRKKKSVYEEIKRFSPKLIKSNREFFKKQIKEDTFVVRLEKIQGKIQNKFKKVFSRK